MVLDFVFVDIALFHIREITTELRSIRICLFVVNGDEASAGPIGALVVVPELLTRVFALRVDLAAECDLIVCLVILYKGIHRRAGLPLAVAKALKQACTGKDGVVRSTRHVDGTKRRRNLVGTRTHAQSSKK